MAPRLASVLAIAMAFCGPAAAAGQGVPAGSTGDQAAERARFHVGPLALQPRLSIDHVGVDSNPLNRADGSRGDLTATLMPAVQTWFRVGAMRVTNVTSYEILYLQRTAAQRSTGLGEIVHLEAPLTRLRPYAELQHTTSHQRPSTEIDDRVEQTTTAGTAGTAIRLGARLELDLHARESRVAFGDATGALALADALDRRSATMGVDGRYALTPLTTFVVRTERTRDRFAHDVLRDTSAVSVQPGVEFKPGALLSGSAFVGYRRFVPDETALPSYAGLVAAVKLKYTWRDSTRFDARASRDVEYSFERETPFYIQTAQALSVTHAVAELWDVVVRGGVDRMAYRNASPAADERRVDRVRSAGAGVGYHFAGSTRLGFDVTYQQRLSPRADRRYSGYRIGGSFTYGS
jgi:hypothetical protein